MARTLTAAERAIVAALRLATQVKFEIEDPDGTRRDVSTSLNKVDWLNAVTLTQDIDQNTLSLQGSLLRDTSTLSLSPFRSDSLVNRTAGGAYGPMLDLWRKWWVSTSVTPPGSAPDWKELAQGRMDVIDIDGTGDSPEIKITGRGEEAVFLDCWISVERSYGSGAGVAVETVLQQMLDDNLGTGRANVGSSGYTVVTPVSPSYLMKPWTQPVGSLGVALAAVADKPGGMVLRFRYNSSNVRELAFFLPNRTASSEDWAIGANEWLKITSAKIDIQGVRNVGKVTYADSTAGKSIVYSPKNSGTVSCAAGAATFSTSQAGVIQNGSVIVVHGVSGCFIVSAFSGTTTCTLTTVGGGVPTFSASNWGTNTSLTNYKKRVDIEIDLSAQTQITTATGAQGFDDAVVSDTMFPNVEMQIVTLGFWFVQLHDYGRFYADRVISDSDTLAGITTITHQMAQGTILTTLGARGKPAGKYAQWRRLAALTAPSNIPNQSAIPLLCRAKVQSTTATQVVFRVAVSDPYPLGDISIAYTTTGTGSASPSSPQVIAVANVTNDIATTGFVDITVNRAAFGSGTGRITFTATSPFRVTSTDSADVPSLDGSSEATLIASSGILLGGNTATKTAGTNAFDQQVYTLDGYTSGAFAQASAPVNNKGVAFGLNTDPLTDADWTSLDYAIYFKDDTTLNALESGVSTALGNYSAGDIAAVTYDGTRIRYSLNGVVLRSVAATPGTKFFFDSSFFSSGAKLNNIRFGPLGNDTQPISVRLTRISETTDQIVVRVEAITPNGSATATVNYSNGGLTVSPATGGTFAATSSFGTTGHVDYTITRDNQGGTPRRVAFTVTATGYVDGTDGVDVPPNSNRNRCLAYSSVNQATSSGIALIVAWDSESYDSNGLHSTSAATSKITVPTGGNVGVWHLVAQILFQSNATGTRLVRIIKNTSTTLAEVKLPPVNGDSTKIQVVAFDDAPSVGDFYEVQVSQTSGGALNILSNSGTPNDGFFAATHQV